MMPRCLGSPPYHLLSPLWGSDRPGTDLLGCDASADKAFSVDQYLRAVDIASASWSELLSNFLYLWKPTKLCLAQALHAHPGSICLHIFDDVPSQVTRNPSCRNHYYGFSVWVDPDEYMNLIRYLIVTGNWIAQRGIAQRHEFQHECSAYFRCAVHWYITNIIKILSIVLGESNCGAGLCR